MKRLIYTFALLFVTLSAMAEYNLPASYYVYFANTNDWSSETKQFLIGHSTWSTGYKMTSISNTKLFYWQSAKWDGYTQWAVIGTSGSNAWGDEGNSVSNRKGYAVNATALGSNKELKKYSLIYPSGDNKSVYLSTNTSSYSSLLNKTHTIKSYVDDVESSVGGTVSASSYKLSSATATVATSGTTSIVAAYTATIKLTATVNDGYEFIGWYDGSTELSTETTYLYTAPNSEKTISAKFRIKLCDVRLYLKPNSNWKLRNAWFAAYFFGDGECWVKMEDEDGDGIYSCLVPNYGNKNYTTVIFCRMNPSSSTLGWNTKWDQTNDLSLTRTSNFYTISDDAWSYGNGSWACFSHNYFIQPNDWTYDNVNFMLGHSTWSDGYLMKKISNTSLYYNQVQLWTDNTQWAVFHKKEELNGDKKSIENRVKDVDKSTEVVTNALSLTNLLNDGSQSVISCYESLNHNQIIEVEGDGKVSASSFKLKSASETESTSGTTSVEAVYTATVTLIATANTGYSFVGWYDGSTELSTETTYSYIAPNSDKTISAKFDKLCEFDELKEGRVYYIAAETINVANKYDKASIDMEKTSVDGLYQVTIPKGYFDRFVIGDKTFNSEQISTNRYYNGSEWLPYEASLDIPSQTPDRGLYGPIFYQKTISGEDVNKWHWISLPFNAKISEIKGGDFGTDFMIQEYDTEARSKWTSNIASENESAWRWMEKDETLMAGRGYILAVDDTIQSVTLNFKSLEALNIIKNQFDGNNEDYSSGVTESANWHLIGTGLYGVANSFGGVDYVAIPQGNDYEYYNLSEEGLADLNAYGAFFVQHSGNYSFSKEAQIRNSAPRRIMEEDMVEHYYVSIGSGENAVNTAIFMAEDGTDNYVVGQDFLHLGASGESLQFYSKQGKNDLAFNYLKKEERTIALGGYVAEAGKYTISLTADGKASSVILYDSQTGEATDLLQYDYEFDAEKGYLDGRFDITIAYAAQDDTPTDVEIGGNDRLVVLNSDGIVTFEGLAIGEEVVIYDIMGRCVNHFVASNDVANVMLADGVYVMKHSSEIIKFVVNR